jgi:predicted ester cyclase
MRPTGRELKSHKFSTVRNCTALALLMFAPAFAADGVKIYEIKVATSISESKRGEVVNTASAFYDFWNSGDETFLKSAIASTFIDHTLPPGRPQGPDGPSFASRQFRAAVPDLSVTVEKMIVAGEYVTVHMKFAGHFTGAFGKVRGNSQAISFIATDLLKVVDGRVTDNWHIEDNLTLLRQMGIAKVED